MINSVPYISLPLTLLREIMLLIRLENLIQTLSTRNNNFKVFFNKYTACKRKNMLNWKHIQWCILVITRRCNEKYRKFTTFPILEITTNSKSRSIVISRKGIHIVTLFFFTKVLSDLTTKGKRYQLDCYIGYYVLSLVGAYCDNYQSSLVFVIIIFK